MQINNRFIFCFIDIFTLTQEVVVVDNGVEIKKDHCILPELSETVNNYASTYEIENVVLKGAAPAFIEVVKKNILNKNPLLKINEGE